MGLGTPQHIETRETRHQGGQGCSRFSSLVSGHKFSPSGDTCSDLQRFNGLLIHV